MARTNERGLELSFKKYGGDKQGGRWFKTIQGKVIYCGSGAGVSDRESYRKALDAFNQRKELANRSVMRATAVQNLNQLLESVSPMLNGANGRPSIPLNEFRTKLTGLDLVDAELSDEFARMADDFEKEEITDDLLKLSVEDLRTLKPQPGQQPIQTVASLVALFLDAQETRMRSRLKIDQMNVDGKAEGKQVQEPKRQNLSQSRYVSIMRDAKPFVAMFGKCRWDGTEATASRICKAYRQHVEKRLNNDEVKPNSVNESVKFLRQFCGWAEVNYYLDRLPRDKALFRKYDYTKSAKAIPLDVLYKLYDNATDLEKLWIMLGLNCGFYSKDLSDLTDEMVLPGFINHTRGKTGVNVVYKLWAETECQLKKFMPFIRSGSPVFLTEDFTRLNHYRPGKKDKGKFVKVDNVRNHFFRLAERLDITGYSWANMRDTATTRIEKIDPTLTDLFIAHKDDRMAMCYVDGKMVDHSRLDKAIDQLEKVFKGLWSQKAR